MQCSVNVMAFSVAVAVEKRFSVDNLTTGVQPSHKNIDLSQVPGGRHLYSNE